MRGWLGNRCCVWPMDVRVAALLTRAHAAIYATGCFEAAQALPNGGRRAVTYLRRRLAVLRERVRARACPRG